MYRLISFPKSIYEGENFPFCCQFMGEEFFFPESIYRLKKFPFQYQFIGLQNFDSNVNL